MRTPAHALCLSQHFTTVTVTTDYTFLEAERLPNFRNPQPNFRNPQILQSQMSRESQKNAGGASLSHEQSASGRITATNVRIIRDKDAKFVDIVITNQQQGRNNARSNMHRHAHT
jgi:hypothetical protein